jgi:hypothetical protein
MSGYRQALALGRAVAAVLARPVLWPSVARLMPPRWWHRWPPRPWPPTEYLRFRSETMYGSDREPDPADLIRYLEWCRRMGHSAS